MDPIPAPNPPAPQRYFKPVILVISFTFALTFSFFLAGKIANNLIAPPVEQITIREGVGKQIAMFRIEGIIRGSGESDANGIRLLCRQIREAAEDPQVAGALFEINSPGGEVAASDTIRKALDDFRLSGKPVVCYFDALAASGGYYIGSGGDYIVCHPQSFTASIGVIIQAPSYVGLFEKTGLQMHTFKSGKLKDMLNGARPLNAEEIAYTQELVDKTYNTFLNLVATSRKLDPEKLRTTVADGRVVLGTDAVTHGLVDSNGYLDDAIKKIRQMSKAPEAPIVYRRIHAKKDGLAGLLSKGNQKIEVSLGSWNAETLTPGVPYALYGY